MSSTTVTRRQAAILAAALIVACALQSWLVWRSPAVAPDTIGFVVMAEQLAVDPLGTMRRLDQHPGYPALVLAVERVYRLAWPENSATWRAAALTPPFLCGPLVVLFIWLLTREAFDVRSAGFAALLAAVLPVLRQNAADGLSDTPEMAAFSASLWFGTAAFRRRSAGWAFGAGAASGLAFWMRPEGLSAALAAFAVYLVLLVVDRWQARWRWRELAALACGMTLAVGPYVVLAGKLTSKVTSKPAWEAWGLAALEPTAPKTNSGDLQPHPRRWKFTPVYFGGASSEAAPPVLQSHSRVSDAPRGPLIAVLLTALKELGERISQSLRYLLLAPLAIGLIAPGRVLADRWAGRFLATLCGLYMGVLVALYFLGGYLDQRHLLPLLAVLLPLIGVGFVWIEDRLRSLRRPFRVPGWVAAWVPLAIATATLLPRTLRPLHEDLAHLVAAADFVRAHYQSGDRVLTNARHVLFYADVRGRLLGEDPEADRRDAQSGEYRFVVVDLEPGIVSPEWLEGVERLYDDRRRVRSRTRKIHYDVIVFERRAEVARALEEDRST